MRIFGSSITFNQFSRRAQIANPNDELIVQGNLVTNASQNFQGTATDAMRKKTWKVFLNALSRAFPKGQSELVKTRYRLNCKDLAEGKEPQPLLARYVDRFGIFAGVVDTLRLKAAMSKQFWFQRKLEDCSLDDLRRLYAEATNHVYLPNKMNPQEVYGGPRELHENFAADRPSRDEQRYNLFQGIGQMQSPDRRIPDNHAYLSRLAMAIVSTLETDEKNSEKDMVIPAPGIKKGQIDFYKIHQVISPADGGLTAVALIPISKHSHLKPILAFRCTKQAPALDGFFHSFLDNLGVHIGKNGYEKAEGQLRELMKDPKFKRPGEKIDVLCYSQGGSHAAYFMKDHWENVGDFISFNITGSDKEIVENLANEINESPAHIIPPRLYLYRNVLQEDGMKGDWVNTVGEKHIGWGLKHPNSFVQLVEFIIDDFPDPPSDNPWDPTQYSRWLKLHAVRPMDMDKIYAYNLYQGATQCDPILLRNTMEKERINLGNRILFYLFSWVYGLINFLWRLFGFPPPDANKA